MAKHTLDIGELRDTVVEQTLASSAKVGGRNKHLKVTISLASGAISYEVNGAKTDTLERAVELYNALP